MVLFPIVNNYDLLTKTEKAIADYIIANPTDAFSLNASELAERTQSSPATVGRFSKKIGFDSYVEAKIRMMSLTDPVPDTPSQSRSLFIEKNDSYQSCAKKLLSQITNVCVSTMNILDYTALERTISALLVSNNIYLAGIGASSVIIQDLNLKLIRLQKKTHYSRDYHVNLLEAKTAQKKDVLLAFSYSGHSKVVLETVRTVNEQGALTIAVTGSANTPLAKAADIVLCSPALEQSARIGAVSSHYSQQFIADLIFLGMITHLYDEADSMIASAAETIGRVR